MNAPLQEILPTEIGDKWNCYLRQRNIGLKNEARETLNDVITSLELLDRASLNQFVFHITDLHRTEGEKIDFHLFEKIVLPCLIDGVLKNWPTYHRRLAQFDQMLPPTGKLFSLLKKKLRYENDYFDSADFFKKELELNPDDEVAVDGMLHRIASGLNHAVHELPEHALLWDLDFFEAELQAFRKYLPSSNYSVKWNEALARWSFVSMTWRGFEKSGETYERYAGYLKANNLKFK